MKVGCERRWKDVSVFGRSVKSTRLPVGGDGLIIATIRQAGVTARRGSENESARLKAPEEKVVVIERGKKKKFITSVRKTVSKHSNQRTAPDEEPYFLENLEYLSDSTEEAQRHRE